MKKTVFILSMLLVLVVSGCSKKKIERDCPAWYYETGKECAELRSTHYGTYSGEFTIVSQTQFGTDSSTREGSCIVSDFPEPIKSTELKTVLLDGWVWLQLNDPHDGTFSVTPHRDYFTNSHRITYNGSGKFINGILIYEYVYEKNYFKGNGEFDYRTVHYIWFTGKRI